MQQKTGILYQEYEEHDNENCQKHVEPILKIQEKISEM